MPFRTLDLQKSFMRIADYDFYLPPDLIAQYPLGKRDHSKLLVLHRDSGEIEHKIFYEVIDYLEPEDGLVINQTKIFPARLFGNLDGTSSKIEILLLRKIKDDLWDVLVKPGRKAKIGKRIVFNQDKLSCEILDNAPSGGRLVKFFYQEDFFDIIDKIGVIPLPPYVKREPEPKDKMTYQTVYAKERGAVAGPTAGFHFTEKLLEKIKAKDILVIPLVLHVGLGTFRPIKVNEPEKHRMEPEYFKIEKDSAEVINRVKSRGKRIIAVGTSTVRALETVASDDGFVKPRKEWTDKFIYPPYEFKVVDAIITNFHLPKSTLLLLVSAFAGRDLILKAYKNAIEREYRFYSYGDAMLLVNG